ncbi:MAG TPA: hypothetical protein VFO47_04655, partial [Actinomycetes bacterium]|nr:hypothetical protein [Actinomycetes bacterium]
DDFAADADPLVELAGLFERAEYAPAEPDGDQAAAARRLARSARAGLAGRLGWRRRLLAAVSPRSLVAGRAAVPRETSREAPSRERELVGQARL